jgi:glycosyltransferase involved in cell wall biosynthesis
VFCELRAKCIESRPDKHKASFISWLVFTDNSAILEDVQKGLLMTKSRLHIAHVTLNYKPYAGGVVSSLTSLSTELINQGHQPTIITLNFTGNDASEDHVERIACWGRFRYKSNPIAIPTRPYKQLLYLFNTIKPDVVHIHHPFILGPAAVRVAQKLKIPTVFTHHSLYEQYAHYIPLPKKLVAPFCNKLVKKFCTTVDHIIAPSLSIKKHLLEQSISTPISIVPSSIGPLFTHVPRQQKALLEKRPINLLTVSRFVPEKNIIWLLDAYHKLINTSKCTFTFTLVGYGAWKAQLEFHAYQKLGLNRAQIMFVEKPSKDQLLRSYQEADIFVFASQSETQGIVHAEAMSQSTPVVALTGPGTNDIVQSGVNGFVVQSPAEFIEKIKHIISDQTQFSHLQNGAHSTAQEYYPARLTQKMVKLYQDLLTRHTQS